MPANDPYRRTGNRRFAGQHQARLFQKFYWG